MSDAEARARKARARSLPAPGAPAEGYALPVYRCQLVQERTLAVTKLQLSNPRDCASLIWHYLDQPDREHAVVLCLDEANTLLGIHTAAVGTLTRTPMAPREILKAALLLNAERIVIGHNHMDDDVRPSRQDREITRILDRAARAVDIMLADHVIVGRSKRVWYSFLDEGKLKP